MATITINALMLEWVGEWVESARERNTKGLVIYRKAWKSLKACPLTFSHPSEAQQLHGFGSKICDRLTEKLQAHCNENGLPMPEDPRRVSQAATAEDETAGKTKKTKKSRPYVPALRSGAYALVLALATLDEEASTGLTKAETIEVAQHHCDASFTAPSDPSKFYTAWNSIKTLMDKDLVYERGRPLRRYALTEEGWEVAKRIKKTDDTSQPQPPQAAPSNREQTRETDDGFVDLASSPVRQPPSTATELVPDRAANDLIPLGETPSESSSLPSFTPIILRPSMFSVCLILDVREVRAKQDRDYMQDELSKKGVTPIMRSLEVGDALWVAKCNDPDLLRRLGAEGDEIMLDWIVERKRLDDLVASIKDGRFHEQKFRLKRSGVKNVIYIIEEIAMNADHFHKYEEAVESAIASSQVVNGYFVKKTQKMDDTIRYLTRMTMLLKSIYETEPLRIIPTRVLTAQNYLPLLKHLNNSQASFDHYVTYPAFASLASKSDNITLKDLFLKMLMCTKGITGEKAMEIQKRWKTPREFVEAFERCGSGEAGRKRKNDMVSDEMGGLIGRKRIAKTLSQKIAEVWTDV